MLGLIVGLGGLAAGLLLLEPHDKSCQFGVIFFNNVGCLGMCGHGTMGLIATLAIPVRAGLGDRLAAQTPDVPQKPV